MPDIFLRASFWMQAIQMDLEKMNCLRWVAALTEAVWVNSQTTEIERIEQCIKIWNTYPPPPPLYGVTLQGKVITSSFYIIRKHILYILSLKSYSQLLLLDILKLNLMIMLPAPISVCPAIITSSYLIFDFRIERDFKTCTKLVLLFCVCSFYRRTCLWLCFYLLLPLHGISCISTQTHVQRILLFYEEWKGYLCCVSFCFTCV